MGLDSESDSQQSCSSDLSPNTVLPSRKFLDAEKRKKSSKVIRKDDLLAARDGFTEINYRRYRSASCKTHCRPLESKIEFRRGSVYQSSKEVREMKNYGNGEGRKKIELSRESVNSFSFSIVDSLCSLDKENSQKKISSLSVNSKSNSSNEFIEMRPKLAKMEKRSAVRVRSDSIENSALRCEEVVVPVNDANELLEKDLALTFHKSFSAKAEIPCSPSASESDCSSSASSKSRFRGITKMFDPFTKSKSLKSPLGHISGTFEAETTGKNPILRESLVSSPVHLHGFLELERRHGLPYLKFSLDTPEEVLIAKTWKGNNAFNWVYTFHSVSGQKKSNAGSCGINKESSVIGQMQVSTFVCSEVKDGSVFDDSLLTEFVLYDIAHGRQSFSSQDSIDRVKSPNDKLDNAAESDTFDSSNPCPWPSSVLHSDLEISAVVIQLPIDKRKSLKYQSGNKSSNQMHSNVLKQGRKGTKNRKCLEKVKVVIPNGNHSLPTDESRGPSRLLDRWRSGGGCDCGGWDMGCPITILGSKGINCAEDEPLVVNQRPLEIFLQGAKQKLAALTMRVVEEGKYGVDFHAQLSTLQAFSICVSVLHRIEAPSITSAGEQGKVKELAHCNSLKNLIGEEVQCLTTVEEKTKKSSAENEEIQQSYTLNPPFSPIARV